jgi:Tfp pilus assembly protein PilF
MVPMPAPGAAAVPVPGDGQQLSAIPVSPNLGAPGSDLVPPGSENATPAAPAAVATPATSAAAAPASKPRAGVTIPTPEQLAAIPDPAIRAEAMRDAAERSARQATMEGPPPPSTATPIEAATAPEPTEIKQHRQTPRLAAQGVAGASTRQPNTAKERTAPPTAVGENGDVRFVRSKDTSQVAPPIQHGYTALQAGDLATARQQYDLALLQDPTSRDALLGSAAVAMREHDGNQASANYLRLLELDPNDPEALAGLAELRPGDLQANEIKLRGLARQHPESGPVQFALGNLYARQGRWPEAQQSYFRAFTAVPNNADYAFNLGVGLDRMNQPRLAKTYYRRALELAQASPPGFNVDAVRERLQVLETPAQ